MYSDIGQVLKVGCIGQDRICIDSMRGWTMAIARVPKSHEILMFMSEEILNNAMAHQSLIILYAMLIV